jgi:hypothetical protein
MDVIYDYLQEVGDTAWAAHPAMNVSTKNIDPITVGGAANTPAAATPAVQTAAPTPAANPTSNRTNTGGTAAPRTPPPPPVKK